MNSKAVQTFRIPSLLLAAALQVLPIVRAALPAAETAANFVAIICRWTAGLAAALGGVQAVSGASTTITNPLNVSGAVGKPLTLTLTTAPEAAHYWTASNLPAGLALVGTSGSTSWKIQGTPTVTGTTSVLLTAKDQSNSSAKLTVTATLIINIAPGAGTPPSIPIPPASLTVAQNQNAVFSVTATGTAPLNYQWRFSGNNLAGRTNATLTLNSVTTTDNGNYDVMVGNSSGSITSRVATLTVVVPPTITSPPASLTITQGQNALFTVGASGTSPLTYFWRKGTAVVSVSPDPSFAITNAQVSDGGSFSVVASNFAGTATSSAAVLTVLSAPQPAFVLVSPTNRAVVTGSGTTFTVAAGGATPLYYQWYFNNTPVSGQTSPSCTIPAVQSANAGSYYAVVTNAYGSATSQVATLSLIAPPQISTLAVEISGPGSVNPNYNGQLLQIGGVYTMTATPDSGGVFSGWSGGAIAASPTLTFTMQSNLVLRANFASSSVTFAKGRYNGLFHEPDEVRHFSSGFFAATTTRKGAFSASILILGRKFSWSGHFDSSGHATNSVKRARLSTLSTELTVNAADPDRMSGRISDSSWSAPLVADRAVFDATQRPAPQAGRYTLVFPGVSGATDSPEGDGFATVTVDRAGRVKLKGVLSNGGKISQGAGVSRDGWWPLQVSLYSGTGELFGWLLFTNRAGDDLNGKVSWIKSQQPTAAYYPAGFAVDTDATGSKYQPPVAGSRVLDFSTGQLQLTGGNLSPGLTNEIVLTPANKLMDSRSVSLPIIFTLKDGLFKGSVSDSATGRSMSIKGALLQKSNYGCGFFLGSNQSGRVYLGP